jgi:hypothetical protein
VNVREGAPKAHLSSALLSKTAVVDSAASSAESAAKPVGLGVAI